MAPPCCAPRPSSLVSCRVSQSRSYLFLNQVLQQPSNPPGYPMTWQASYPADYGMDPGVAFSTNYGLTITNDLSAIPTMSIATDLDRKSTRLNSSDLGISY